MAVSAISIANQFINLAERHDKKLTNMQLQKLVYIAHGFHLGFLSQPLFYDMVEAWAWGPVIRPLYRALRRYGAGNVTEPIEGNDSPPDLSKNAQIIIEKVWESYGKYNGFQLSNITHQPNTPWSQARKSMNPYISNEIITTYYRGLINERRQRTAQQAENVG